MFLNGFGFITKLKLKENVNGKGVSNSLYRDNSFLTFLLENKTFSNCRNVNVSKNKEEPNLPAVSFYKLVRNLSLNWLI